MKRTRWSAAKWGDLARALYLYWALPWFLGGIFLFSLSLVVPPHVQPEIRALGAESMIWFAVMLFLATIVGSLIVEVRQRAEARAGYVTFRLVGQNLAQVIPGTNFVIRQPDEPFLTAQEYFDVAKVARIDGYISDARIPSPSRRGAGWAIAACIVTWVLVVAVAVVLLPRSTGFIVLAGSLFGLGLMGIVLPIGIQKRRTP